MRPDGALDQCDVRIGRTVEAENRQLSASGSIAKILALGQRLANHSELQPIFAPASMINFGGDFKCDVDIAAADGVPQDAIVGLIRTQPNGCANSAHVDLVLELISQPIDVTGERRGAKVPKVMPRAGDAASKTSDGAESVFHERPSLDIRRVGGLRVLVLSRRSAFGLHAVLRSGDSAPPICGDM